MLTNRNGLGRRTGDRDWRETPPGPADTVPGTEAKIRGVGGRAAGEMDLYDADDPCISNETGEIIGGKKAAVGEEVELLQQMGYQGGGGGGGFLVTGGGEEVDGVGGRGGGGGGEGGVFFVTAFVLPLERGQLLLLQEKEEVELLQ